MAKYEATETLILGSGATIAAGEQVDGKQLGSDVASLLEQGSIVKPGDQATPRGKGKVVIDRRRPEVTAENPYVPPVVEVEEADTNGDDTSNEGGGE